MARKRHSDKDAMKLPGKVELELTAGETWPLHVGASGSAMRRIATCGSGSAAWGRAQLSELKSLEKMVAEFELDKLVLKERLNCLKPRA